MKLNIGKPKTPVATTTLQEKTSGFKFSLPKQSRPAQTNSADATQKPVQHEQKTSGTGSKGILGSKGGGIQDKPNPLAEVKKHDNAIPKISAEKFNIVAESTPTLSVESATKFQEMVEMLEENIDNEGELQNVLKGTLEYLNDNPEVDAILTPESRAIFVKAARNSYGITLVAKTARKAKTTKATKKVDALMDELADLDFTL